MNLFAQTANRSGALGRRIASRTREIGFLGMLRHLAARLVQGLKPVRSGETDAFDLAYGTDTAKTVGVWALDIPFSKQEHAVRYETVAPQVFSESLATLEISHEEFVFIDLGSGKGRALLLASRLPFKEIIGVEVSARLHAVANRNLHLFKDNLQKCCKMRSVCEDVTDYRFPPENLVLYLYNPFDEHVMQSVVSKVEDFIHHFSRRVYVVYHNPLHRNVWDRSEALQLIKVQDRCVIYTSKN